MKKYYAVVILLFYGLLVACVGAPHQTPHTHYGLEARLTSQVRYGVEGLVLVERVQAEGIVAGRPLLKKIATQPLQLRETQGHLWRTAPSALVQEAVVRTLDGGSADLRFLPAGIGVLRGDYVLRLALTSFYWDASSKLAEVDIYANVRRLKDDKLLLSKAYRRIGVAGYSPPAGAKGLGDTLGLVLDDFSKDFSKSLAKYM